MWYESDCSTVSKVLRTNHDDPEVKDPIDWQTLGCSKIIHQNSPWQVLLCFYNNSRKCHFCVIAFNIATKCRKSRYRIDWDSLDTGSNPKRKAMKLNDEGRGFTWECCIFTPKAFISRHQCCLVPMPNQASRHPSWHVQVVQHLPEMLKTVGRQKQANEQGKWQITQRLRIWNNAILVMIPQNEAPLEGQNHLRCCIYFWFYFRRANGLGFNQPVNEGKRAFLCEIPLPDSYAPYHSTIYISPQV